MEYKIFDRLNLGNYDPVLHRKCHDRFTSPILYKFYKLAAEFAKAHKFDFKRTYTTTMPSTVISITPPPVLERRSTHLFPLDFFEEEDLWMPSLIDEEPREAPPSPLTQALPLQTPPSPPMALERNKPIAFSFPLSRAEEELWMPLDVDTPVSQAPRPVQLKPRCSRESRDPFKTPPASPCKQGRKQRKLSSTRSAFVPSIFRVDPVIEDNTAFDDMLSLKRANPVTEASDICQDEEDALLCRFPFERLDRTDLYESFGDVENHKIICTAVLPLHRNKENTAKPTCFKSGVYNGTSLALKPTLKPRDRALRRSSSLNVPLE